MSIRFERFQPEYIRRDKLDDHVWSQYGGECDTLEEAMTRVSFMRRLRGNDYTFRIMKTIIIKEVIQIGA
jgi:hypothetical protein